MKRLPLLLIIVLLASSCTMHGHIYNLQTGETTVVNFSYNGSGHGHLSATTAAGEAFNGEYTTIADATYGWGTIYGTGGSATASTGTVGGKHYGSATATGNKGTIIECEYVTGVSNHGSGFCKDNHGGKYKLMF